MSAMMKLAASSALALGLVSAPVFAQEDWDTDGDAQWSEEEFGTGLGETEAFGTFDEDDDEAVTEDEWGAGFGEDYEGTSEEFAENDEDGDSAYNEDEFGGAMFGEYDEDESGFLEEEEQTAFTGEAEEDGWF